MTDKELIVALRKEITETRKAFIAEIEHEKARVEALTAENFKLAAGSCDVEGGKVGDEHGHFYCTLQAKVEALTADNEQWQVDYNEAVIDKLELETENHLLRVAAQRLGTYSAHDDDCRIMTHGVWSDPIPCTCGYTDALASISSTGEETMTTETPPDWVLLEAAKRADLGGRSIEVLQDAYRYGSFRALCDMIQKYEKPPVDRKVLCAREALTEASAEDYVHVVWTDEDIAVRAIELWEEGFGK